MTSFAIHPHTRRVYDALRRYRPEGAAQRTYRMLLGSPDNMARAGILADSGYPAHEFRAVLIELGYLDVCADCGSALGKTRGVSFLDGRPRCMGCALSIDTHPCRAAGGHKSFTAHSTSIPPGCCGGRPATPSEPPATPAGEGSDGGRVQYDGGRR